MRHSTWKHVLALLLCAVLLVGNLSFAALAEPEDGEPAEAEAPAEGTIRKIGEEPAPAEPEDEGTTLEDGIYLVGTMNNWAAGAAYKFAPNPGAEGEYMLHTTLTEGDKLKILDYKNDADDTWYPAGEDYTVDAAHAGTVTIYFRSQYNSDWSAFDGHFYIAVEEAPATAYALWVGGVQVDESNASNILGDGNVSFDAATGTLTFAAQKPTLSGTHNGAMIDAEGMDLIITAPNGLTLKSSDATKNINVTGGALTVNGKLDLSLDSSSAEACIWVENGLTVTGNVSLTSWNNDDSYGILSSKGPVTINGASDFMCKHTGIYCGSGDVKLTGTYAAFGLDSNAVFGFSPSACIYTANGGVEVDAALEFFFGNTEYLIYANGPVTTKGIVTVTDDVACAKGIISTGNIVCNKDVDLVVNSVALKTTGEKAGITVNANATLANQFNEMSGGIIEATAGPISVTGNLKVTAYGACVVSARDDITVGGNANVKVETYNVSARINKAMRSTQGSINITGDLVTSSSDSGVYAYKDITVGGSVTLGGGIYKLVDYGIMAETGALFIGGDLTNTRLAKTIACGKTGVTVKGSVSINDTFREDVSPTGCYGIYAPDGSVSVDGTLKIATKREYIDTGTLVGPEFGVCAGDKIVIAAKWDVTASGTALLAANGIEKPANYGVTAPEGGRVKQLADGWTVTEADGETVAAQAVIDEVAMITIIFDLNGGEGEIESVQIPSGGSLEELPAPTREKYKLIGWYTETATGTDVGITGTKVTLETVFTEDTTIYAHWYMPGDVNGDGDVTTRDFVRLMKYLAAEDVKVVHAAVDVNGDGEESTRDFVRLMKYLAGEDVEIF